MWHKISENDLPIKNKEVLCVTAHKNLVIGYLTTDDLWDMQCDDMMFWEISDVVAWTELPEYKE